MTGRTLLYVDPDPATRRLVRRVLEPEGYTVVEAESAVEGRRSAERSAPDIILVDVDLVRPADFVTPLREAPGMERVAILASTARAWPDDHEDALKWGFERVLLKPLDVDRLPNDLGECLPGWAATIDADAVAEAAAEPGQASDAEDRERIFPSETAGDVEEREQPFPSEGTGDDALAVEVRDVPLLWRLTLTPVTENFVKAIPTTHGLLALLDETLNALTLVAASSIRPVREAPTVGTRVPLARAPWVVPILESRQAAVLGTETLGDSALIPGESSIILVVPVGTADRLYGVAVLGEQRNPKFATFSPSKMSQSVAEARQIAAVVEVLNQLDASIRLKRDELHQARVEAIRTLLASGKDHLRTRRPRRGEPGRERGWRLPASTDPADRVPMTRLGLDLAARLRVPAPERETLRQALEVLDVGRVWMEELLFPRAGFSDGEREALLREYSGHSVAILAALDWPPAVLELVGAHQAWWNGEGHPPGLAGDQIPMGARIMSVVAAYFDELGGAEGDEGPPAAERVFEALTREGGRRFDPAVVSALTAVDLPAR